MSIIYYDFETTGLNQFHDKITEYCFLKENPTQDMIQSLVNPQKPVTPFITRLTGITQQMVNSAPIFQDQYMGILEFISSNNGYSYLVAHNGDNYDFLMFREHLKLVGFNLNNMTIRSLDTLLLAKKMYPNLSKYSLSNLCTQFNCGVLGAHRAEADTKMVQNLFRYMMNDLSNILNVSLDTLNENPELIYNYINGN
jgi:DNA polymerase III alpha subunit (gram-positive type)